MEGARVAAFDGRSPGSQQDRRSRRRVGKQPAPARRPSSIRRAADEVTEELAEYVGQSPGQADKWEPRLRLAGHVLFLRAARGDVVARTQVQCLEEMVLHLCENPDSIHKTLVLVNLSFFSVVNS